MSYQVDPNDNTKMSPKALPESAFGKATTPAEMTLQDRPSYIFVNMNGTYAFTYSSGSLLSGDGAGGRELYTTGSVVDDAAGPIRLDIQPVAWRQTDATGTVGDITFVYQGGL